MSGKSKTGLIVIIVVLALVVLSVAGWTFWPRGGPDPDLPTSSPQPTTTPTIEPSSPASIVKVPYDAATGLATPDSISAVGVWSGVAVLALYYQGSQSVIIRGVSVETGQVLWTYDEVSATARPIQGLYSEDGVDPADGKLVMAIQKAGSGPEVFESLTYCAGDTYFLILSPLTGEGRLVGAIDSQCVEDQDGITYVIAYPVAYRDGILIVDLYHWVNASDQSVDYKTVAYRDTDLNKPLWEYQEEDYRFFAYYPLISDVIIFGDLVRTVSGTYVSLSDGSRSGFSAYEKYGYSTFIQTDGIVVNVVKILGTDEDPDETFTLAGYTSPDPGHPTWRYADTPEWTVPDFNMVGCLTSQALIIHMYSQGDSRDDESTMTAISLANGQQLWSFPSYVSPTYMNNNYCTVLQGGDHELVAFADSQTLRLVDGATGVEYAAIDAIEEDSDSFSTAIYRCGHSEVCLVDDEQQTIKAIDYSSPDLPILWTEQFPPGTTEYDSEVFTTENGLVIVGTTVGDGWFLVVS